MKAKPIFIVRLPIDIFEKDRPVFIQDNLRKKLHDYHVIVLMCNVDEPKFEAFYEKDFNEVKFEELKQIVKDSLK